jgi:hypothetical protein
MLIYLIIRKQINVLLLAITPANRDRVRISACTARWSYPAGDMLWQSRRLCSTSDSRSGSAIDTNRSLSRESTDASPYCEWLQHVKHYCDLTYEDTDSIDDTIPLAHSVPFSGEAKKQYMHATWW